MDLPIWADSLLLGVLGFLAVYIVSRVFSKTDAMDATYMRQTDCEKLRAACQGPISTRENIQRLFTVVSEVKESVARIEGHLGIIPERRRGSD